MKNKTLETSKENEVKELTGNLSLIGFETLNENEMDSLRKIVMGHLKKIELMGNLKEMRVNLKKHAHGKTFKHEISALAILDEGKFNAESTDWNLNSALNQVFEKMISGLNHQKNRK